MEKKEENTKGGEERISRSDKRRREGGERVFALGSARIDLHHGTVRLGRPPVAPLIVLVRFVDFPSSWAPTGQVPQICMDFIGVQMLTGRERQIPSLSLGDRSAISSQRRFLDERLWCSTLLHEAWCSLGRFHATTTTMLAWGALHPFSTLLLVPYSTEDLSIHSSELSNPQASSVTPEC